MKHRRIGFILNLIRQAHPCWIRRIWRAKNSKIGPCLDWLQWLATFRRNKGFVFATVNIRSLPSFFRKQLINVSLHEPGAKICAIIKPVSSDVVMPVPLPCLPINFLPLWPDSCTGKWWLVAIPVWKRWPFEMLGNFWQRKKVDWKSTVFFTGETIRSILEQTWATLAHLGPPCFRARSRD